MSTESTLPGRELGSEEKKVGRRHLSLSKFEPHEYIIYSKKTNKKLRAGWFERGQKRKREMNSPIRSSWDCPKTDPVASYHTIRKKRQFWYLHPVTPK